MPHNLVYYGITFILPTSKHPTLDSSLSLSSARLFLVYINGFIALQVFLVSQQISLSSNKQATSLNSRPNSHVASVRSPTKPPSVPKVTNLRSIDFQAAGSCYMMNSLPGCESENKVKNRPCRNTLFNHYRRGQYILHQSTISVNAGSPCKI